MIVHCKSSAVIIGLSASVCVCTSMYVNEFRIYDAARISLGFTPPAYPPNLSDPNQPMPSLGPHHPLKRQKNPGFTSVSRILIDARTRHRDKVSEQLI